LNLPSSIKFDCTLKTIRNDKESKIKKIIFYNKFFNMWIDNYTSREIIPEKPKYKVYEVKNINDVGFGKSSKCSTDKDKLHFAVNGPLVKLNWEPVVDM